jgi:hypothetical protein
MAGAIPVVFVPIFGGCVFGYGRSLPSSWWRSDAWNVAWVRIVFYKRLL